MNVALTGDIGSGKSTVLRQFAEAGCATFSADAGVHELLRTDRELIDSICERWGEELRDQEGGIDRRKLGDCVFAGSTAEREELEHLIHPRVRQMWQQFLETNLEKIAVVEIPLLFEKRLETSFDCSVTVYSSLETKIERLIVRGMKESDIRARLAAQLDQESKASRSDFLILNNGSLDFLRKQVGVCLHNIQHP
ncbi:MAG: dephospho-CoA kinase [Puniceicoccaceae bacterium]